MKYNNRQIAITTVLLLSITLAFLFTGCAKNDGNTFTSDKISPDWESAKSGFSSPVNRSSEYKKYLSNAENSLGKHVSSMSASGPQYPVDQMLEEVSLVVRGTVLGFDYLNIRHVDGTADMLFTDYYVDVHETLRGEAETDENSLIRVRTLGGENDTSISINSELNLKIGTECLFFLFKPAGGDYNTGEYGYYYPYALSSGVYVAGDETVENARGETVPKTFTCYSSTRTDDRELEYLTFTEKLEEYNKTHPVDVYKLANQAKENLLENLKSGFLSQEEYDKLLAEFDQYATIIE